MILWVVSVVGYSARSRRSLLPAGVALVVLSVGSVAGARSWSVRALSPPVSVASALAKTGQAPYLVLTEASGSGPVRYVIDSRGGRAEMWAGRTVSSVQIGSTVYAPEPSGACYVSAKRPSALLPNVAGMLLPSGIAAERFSVSGRTIRWSIRTSGAVAPHGTVRVNAAGRIVAATVVSGPGVPLTASVSYPGKAPRISAPARLCGKNKAAGGAQAR